MTRVTLKRGRVNTVKCEGHATGSNEVCAAASMLVYTLLGHLERRGRKPIKEEVREGYAEISFKGQRELYATIETGFLLLAQNYPEYCEVHID